MFPTEIPHLRIRVSPTALANRMIGTRGQAYTRHIDQLVAECFPDREGIVVKTPEGQLTLFTLDGDFFAANIARTDIHMMDRSTLDAAPVADWLALVEKGPLQ